MARLNSEHTLWAVLPIIVVIAVLIGGIIFLPQASTDVRSRASEPLPIITPRPTSEVVIPSKTEAPEIVCSDLYEPVCGSDQKTYSNSCEAGLAGVTTFTDGACLPSKSNTRPSASPQMQFVLPASN